MRIGKNCCWAAQLGLAALLAWMAAGCSRPGLGHDDGGKDADAATQDASDGGDLGEGSSDQTNNDQDGAGDGAVDQTPPCLLNVFSPGEGLLTAHFSENVDPGLAAEVGNYTVRGSSGDSINLQSAMVDGSYVRLQVASGTSFISGTTYQMLVSNVTDLAGNRISTTCNRMDNIKRTLYLNLVWHQHQPLYLDAVRDQLMSPWVRKHATKDYYDMASIVQGYPKVHFNMNLTSVLLTQLMTYYLDRLGPFVDVANNRVDASAFLATWEGKTDPWIDLLLKETPTPESVSELQLGLLHKDAWSCVSTSDVMMQHFPEYRALRDKPRSTYTQEDFRNLKGWFEIAWFDPDFLRSAVVLPNGWVVDLSDVVEQHPDGTFTLRQPITEELCNRLVAEEYKIMANVIPVHRQLLYHPQERTGQIEVLTTPFYHPILPLLHDTDLGKDRMNPSDTLPNPPFRYPMDAFDQVAKAVAFYQQIFGMPPYGMWPGEGSVAQEVVGDFVSNGLLWVATGQEILADSKPSGQKHWYPYRVEPSASPSQGLAIVFRDSGLSNAIGFKYQGMYPDEAVGSFMGDVLAQAPGLGEPDRLLTVILDGENAWENFSKDLDGKQFLHTLYATMQRSYDAGEVITVAGSEYILGNPDRNVPAHPLEQMRKIDSLSAGSWIDGKFWVWVGEPEENVAWNCLLRTRQDLERSRLPRPNPMAAPPSDPSSKEYQIYKAWEEIYAAEGSDWFWWFGSDMTTPANDDTPFDRGFRAHLSSAYSFMNQALAPNSIEPYVCPVIVQESGKTPRGPFTLPPTIDGRFVPNEAEWITEGGFFNDSDSGATANPNDQINRVYYGYDAEYFYLAISANMDLRLLTGLKLEVYFNHKHIVDLQTGQTQMDPYNSASQNGSALVFKVGGPARVLVTEVSNGLPQVQMLQADGQGAWSAQAGILAQVAGPTDDGAGRIMEMRVPYADLHLSYGDPLEMVVLTAVGPSDIDLAPNMGSQVVFEDATNVVKVFFQVDVSGTQIPRDQYGTCCDTPPPPDGSGIVYIAGNVPALGAEGDKWVSNVVSLRDDGQQGDTTAQDRVWTLIVDAQRNDNLKYKYTIGTPSDEGRWAGTEEYPVTFRGFSVVGDQPGKKLVKIVVHDVFADKPVGGRDGNPGSMTTFEYFYEP